MPINTPDLNHVLADLEREHANAVRVAEATGNAIAALRAVIGAPTAGLVGRSTVPTPTSAPPMAGNSATPRISPDARIKAAVEFALRHAGKPLRVREMFDFAKEAGWAYPRDFESFRGTVAPMLKADPMFQRVELGLYKLAGQ